MCPFDRSLHFLCVVHLLFQFTTSQLVGSITRLRKDEYNFVISISNPTKNTISILNWNTIFDPVIPLPASLVFRDDQGLPLRIATTYAMRAGITDTDFLHLLPNQTYPKSFDIRSLLQVVPEGRSGNITVALPAGFKGMSYNGTWTVPAAAAANFTVDPPRLGDFSAAGLQDISLTSRRLAMEFHFPLFDNDGLVDPKPGGALGGIEVGDSCQGLNGTSMTDALFDAGIYANAISLAAKERSSALFWNYFPSRARQTVGSVASSVQKAIKGQGPQVAVRCTDYFKTCYDNNILGLTFTPSNLGPAEIVMCPVARTLPRAPWPCSTHPGRQIGASASRVLLHLILTINSIYTDAITGSVYGSGSCQLLKNSHILATTKNPDSYAQLAMAQWGYGLGGPPYHGDPCPPTLGIVPNVQKRTS
ncbi:MAG: hypothetical protein LQ349_002493 [Xanthoria aureola]|nr:MAG: hypothetical protein LQ349_002493 [Xanthoria aureola]